MIAFNAIFAVLKTTIQNGREIGEVLGSLANTVEAEEDLRVRGNRKKSSIWPKAFCKDADMMEEFQALQDIKCMRAELKFMIQFYAACYDLMGQKRVEHRKATLVSLVV